MIESALLALWSGPVSSWGLPDFLILVIVVAACCGIAILFLQWMGVQIPVIAWRIGAIVLVTFLAIFAIRLIASM